MATKYLRLWSKYRETNFSSPADSAPASKKLKTSHDINNSSASKTDAAPLAQALVLPPHLLQQQLQRAISHLSKLDKHGLFAAPVTEAVAPNYFKIISTPMDLSTIRSKLGRGSYLSLNEFDKDVQQMITNCLTYNIPGDWAYQVGLDFKKEWGNELQALHIRLGKLMQAPIVKPVVAPPVVQPAAVAVPQVVVAEEVKKPDVVVLKPVLTMESDLPIAVESPKLSWLLCMMQDPLVVTLLRLRLANVLTTTLETCLDVNVFCLNDNKCIRWLLQLLQISWTGGGKISAVNNAILRRFFPDVLLSLLKLGEDNSFDGHNLTEIVEDALRDARAVYEDTSHQDRCVPDLLDVCSKVLPAALKVARRKK